MRKLVFNLTSLFPLIIFLSSCSLKTSIKGEFLFENKFKAVKEFENSERCSDADRWFSSNSFFVAHSDETYDLTLQYKSGEEKEFRGEYKISVGNEGHSGEGYFILEGTKIDLIFEKSYFLIFELPIKYNPLGCTTIRILYFQRW